MKHRKQYPNATPYTDTRGKRRWRYRKNGKSFELGTAYGSDEFERRYEAAVLGANIKGMVGADRVKRGTVNDLVARFYKTGSYMALSDGSKATYRGIIEKFRIEHGCNRIQGIKPRHIEDMMATKFNTPNAANNMRKRLSQLLDLAVKLEWIPANPVKQTKAYVVEGGGHHTWTEAEIAGFFKAHKIGSLAHLAVTLMLYTGAARVDVVKLGQFSIKQTVEGERLEYRRQKTRKSNGQLVSIPLHPDLVKVLTECTKDNGTFLQTNYGNQRSVEGLGNAMRKWCDEAGLLNCSAHGLRKACARRLAEAGATAPEIMSITGHKTLAEVQRYIADANRELMADAGMDKLISRPNGEQTVVNISEMFAKNTGNKLINKENKL